ncbi:response regulator transcription factor [Crassaminicella profunda]|uniref:response regulator transcription factor n=1 Tax=Crassaminicella profunda TaxID=1286698 RepID=UPI001CA75398|nr:response regulator transcription factor [Crassaminicella profunda]QZY55252.1 response regulator transcription factor [Crassaminicella profunda]
MYKNFRVLIIEDETSILNVIASYLENAQYEIATAMCGQCALNLFHTFNPHLIILDLMLPDLSGETICEKIRKSSDIPIIILTAKSDESSKIKGFTLGADEYVTKPFSVKVLVKRVDSLIKRCYNTLSTFSFNQGKLLIDHQKRLILKNNIPVNLTPSEYDILFLLTSNPYVAFSRKMIVEKILGHDYNGYERIIDTHIKNLRKKIEDHPKDPKYILTVFGVGYKFGGSHEY